MTNENVELICLTALGIAAIIGIFATKTPGWGRYSMSTLILALALFIAADFLLIGKIVASVFLNITFAIVGYAGGLINGKNE
ncbi:MAG TPA: hypothetical protein VKG84_03370 [Candidatus Acidoferrales bacterium]|nr:hypothetical protein [Candidatus Acidoferrales bacterium]